jgi:hypothetical protein
MKRFSRRYLWVAMLAALGLFVPAPPLNAATVTGTTQITFSFAQTPTTGFLSGTPLPVAETFSMILRASGVAANQVDGLYAHTFTFVASTPQTLDVTSLTDVLGNSITAARARIIAVKVKWTNDGLPLILGANGTTPWTGFLNSAGTLKVFPSSSANDGWFILSAPQTTGIPITGAGSILKMDPGTAAGTVDVIIATCST